MLGASMAYALGPRARFGLAAVLLVMGGAQRAQSTMGVSSLLDSAARRAVAFALRCCCKHVSAKAASPRAPRCAPMCLSLVLCWESSCTQPKQACVRATSPERRFGTIKRPRRPSRLVTGSVASSHLSLCGPAPSLRYRLSQCSAAAAVIFLHGKASSSADLLRCSHYTEA